MTTRRPGLLLLGLLLASQPRLAGQWSLAVEATASYYDGVSRDSGADPTAFRPHHPTGVGLRVDRRLRPPGFGVGAAPGAAGLVAEARRHRAPPQAAPALFEVAAA